MSIGLKALFGFVASATPNGEFDFEIRIGERAPAPVKRDVIIQVATLLFRTVIPQTVGL